MDKSDVVELVKMSTGFFLLIAVVLAGGVLVWNVIYAGTIIEYEGNIQMVSKSSFIVPHTYVVLQTYAGENDEFTLYGYHDLTIGTQYTIKMKMKLYLFGFIMWGELQSMEVVNG